MMRKTHLQIPPVSDQHAPRRPERLFQFAMALVLGALGCDTTADTSRPQPVTTEDPAKAEATLAAAHEIAHGNVSPHGAQAHGAAANTAIPDPVAGGLRWKVQAPLVARPPASSMRAAEYRVTGDGADEAVMTVFYFGPDQGGTVQANVDRWIGQFSQADGKDSQAVAKVEDQKVGDLKVRRLDLTGTYADAMGPMMQAKAEPKSDYRLLGAIVEGPKGPVFFKLVGPSSTVEKAKAAFDSLIGSIQAS